MPTSQKMMPGHVFVVKADITTIKCDAWLCPTDRFFWVESWARTALGLSVPEIQGYDWGPHRAVAFEGGPASAPLVVLGDVGRNQSTRPAEVARRVRELVPVIDEFVEVAVGRLGESHPHQPHRLALPLIGTGEGGLKGAKGDTIEPILDRLNVLARDKDVDLILCTIDTLAWSAVQSVRGNQVWALNDDQERLAKRLALEAQAQRLVLFIGAGVSADAGLPGWGDLLEQLAAPHLSKEELKELGKLDMRDQATLVQQRLGDREALLSKMAEKLGGDDRPVGLTHALLASLGAQQAITTNFDNLFERACAKICQEPLTVLPYGRVQDNRPWLLKLHGSLRHRGNNGGDDIVLTRSDYTRLVRHRGALVGIVQALLVTKHLLFVGYSLMDEDFNELVDEIRTAIRPADAERPHALGTVLTIEDSSLASLFGDVLDVVQIGRGEKAQTARSLQIFLDRVAHLATPHHTHLLDEAFVRLLTPEDQEIAASLRKVEDTVAAINNPTADAVRRMLAYFGSTMTSKTR
jgi:SIR2-like domain